MLCLAAILQFLWGALTRALRPLQGEGISPCAWGRAQGQAGLASYPPWPWPSPSLGKLRARWAAGEKGEANRGADFSGGGRGRYEHKDSSLSGWHNPKSLCMSPTAPRPSAPATNLSCSLWVLSPLQ